MLEPFLFADEVAGASAVSHAFPRIQVSAHSLAPPPAFDRGGADVAGAAWIEDAAVTAALQRPVRTKSSLLQIEPEADPIVATFVSCGAAVVVASAAGLSSTG